LGAPVTRKAIVQMNVTTMAYALVESVRCLVASRWREIFDKIYKLQILRRFVKNGVKPKEENIQWFQNISYDGQENLLANKHTKALIQLPPLPIGSERHVYF